MPLDVYIPDGEPHVFGNRVYLFGSQDKERGNTFCMLDYVFWSAPVNDLTDWSNGGVNYRSTQDPLYNPETNQYMYAPDVVQGNDKRFYLYYCMSGPNGKGCYVNPISVAVCDTPDGKYDYLGQVKTADGQPLMKYVCFDPSVINDDGVIRLYYGASFEFDEHRKWFNNWIFDIVEARMFGRSIKEIRQAAKNGGIMGAFTVNLADDMLTATVEPKRLLPNNTKGTQFADHGYFEASSIRKIRGTYYFIYSSRNNHELCYATSPYPDRDFVYRGTIISNGDIGYHGRTKENRTNTTGTNHGSIECIDGRWYVFYHRLTHLSDFSRQACAEAIEILQDGSIPQVEITSCGLNINPLADEGTYPASIACMIVGGQHMPHGTEKDKSKYPCVFSDNQERFITNIRDHTKIGFKYFDFTGGAYHLSLRIKGQGVGEFLISTSELSEPIGKIPITEGEEWQQGTFDISKGKQGLFFTYSGSGEFKLMEFSIQRKKLKEESDVTKKN